MAEKSSKKKPSIIINYSLNRFKFHANNLLFEK